MEADGFRWVRWGAGHRNNGCRCINGRAGPDLDTYGRGNFPGHDALCVLPKMGVDGCRWVIMDAYGCNGGGMIAVGNKSNAKRAPNGSAGHVLGCMHRVKKCHMLANVDCGGREGQGEK